MDALENTNTQLLKEYEFFKTRLDKLIKTHPNEYALVKDGKILKIFKDRNEGMNYAKEKGFTLGTFLMQKITKEVHHISRIA